MKTVTFFSTLMKHAKEEAEARRSGDPVRIKRAVKNHEAYRQLCLKSDEMLIPNPLGGSVPRQHGRSAKS
jgi:hypothetical protein